MNNIEYWKIVVTVATAVVGWVVGHYFNSLRDRQLKRREIITDHLINAYRILANEVTLREASIERDKQLETLIAELQLFGTLKQIKLAKQLADDIVNKETFYIDDLLVDLRDDLRNQLSLEKVEGRVKWLRFGKMKFPQNSPN